MRVAASRLIDAAAELGADDRALLSLLVNHGLDDEFLAHALHMDAAQLCSRRAQLVDRLAAVLELPADYVDEQLSELSWSAQSAGQIVPPPAPPAPPAPEPSAPPQPPAPPVTPAASAESPSPRQRRRRSGAVLLALAIGLVLVLVVVLVASSGGGKSSSAARRPSGAGAAAGGGGVRVRDHATLAALPGVASGATASIGVTGSAASPDVVISASGLPSAGTGHYEVWLFNSVIDSRPLAVLGPTGGTATVPLPVGYRSYRWIDVSLQAAGSTVHSGLSVLRAAVPGGA